MMSLSAGKITTSCVEHKHSCYEIIFYRKTKGTFFLCNETIPITSGKFIIVPPNTVHASQYEGEAETFFIQEDLQYIFSFPFPVVVSDSSEKEGEFLVNMIFKNRFSNPEYCKSLLNALAHFLLQNKKTEKKTEVAIREIENKIFENFSDSNINLKQILRQSGYAEDYIRAKFRGFTGKTPVEFLTHIRIKHACFLIEVYKDVLSLAEISERCGYTDYSFFSRRFRSIMGVSPSRYMKSL